MQDLGPDESEATPNRFNKTPRGLVCMVRSECDTEMSHPTCPTTR